MSLETERLGHFRGRTGLTGQAKFIMEINRDKITVPTIQKREGYLLTGVSSFYFARRQQGVW